MSVFVDTGLFFSTQVEGSPRHDVASRALRTLFRGEYGPVLTSDYVVDETATLVRSRTGSHDQAMSAIDRMLGRGDFPESVEIRRVNTALFDRAVSVFEQYRDHSLSFTDATTIAVVETANVDSVVAFDDDFFDGIVSRLDPQSLLD